MLLSARAVVVMTVPKLKSVIPLTMGETLSVNSIGITSSALRVIPEQFQFRVM